MGPRPASVLSVVIPVLNEEGRIERRLEEVRHLPGVAEDILEDLRQGRLTLEVRQPSLQQASERLGRRVFNGLLLAAALVASAVLYATDHVPAAALTLAGAGIWGFFHSVAMALTRNRPHS